MTHWKRGMPFRKNSNPNMLEGIPAIATFIGKSYNTTIIWIREHGLPATKTPQGRWFTHKGLILQWIFAGHQAELGARVQYALEKEQIEELAEKMGVDPAEVFTRMAEREKGVPKDVL